MKTLPEQAVGTAHGKIILIGEHAVVYGEPAIALPFMAAPVEVTVEHSSKDSKLISSYYQGPLDQVPDALLNIQSVIHMIGTDLNEPVDSLCITISSSIPAERGMGSSAAIATALVRALFSYFKAPLEHETLLAYVDTAEKIAHGNPSGLDARVTSSESPLYYKKNSVFRPITLNVSGYLVAADTGVKGQTRRAVASVAEQMQQSYEKTDQAIKTIGQLTEKAKQAIEKNDTLMLGKLLTDSHELLRKIEVSNNALDRLVSTALEYGASGAKLTGGGRGGCMIALAETKDKAEKISEKLLEHGAVDTWIHALGEDSNE